MEVDIDLAKGLWALLSAWHGNTSLWTSGWQFSTLSGVLIGGMALFIAYWFIVMMLFINGIIVPNQQRAYIRNAPKYQSTSCVLVDSFQKRKVWFATYEAFINGDVRSFKTEFDNEPLKETTVHYRPDSKAAWVEGDLSYRSDNTACLWFGIPWLIFLLPIVAFAIYIAVNIIF